MSADERKRLLPGNGHGKAAPSALLLSVFGVAVVCFGYSGFAMLRCLMMSTWSEERLEMSASSLKWRLWVSVATHCISLGTAIGTGFRIARIAKPALEGVTVEGRYDARWDNVKFFLTMAVAQAHFLEPLGQGRTWITVIRLVQESFLMQAYVFMSGYLSTPELNKKRLRSIWRMLVSTYVVSQYMYVAVIRIGYAAGLSSNTWYATAKLPRKVGVFSIFWNPWCLTWYLFALILWRLLAPLWCRLRWPLASACAVAVLGGYVAWPQYAWADGGFMRVQETFAYWPYYVVGLFARLREAEVRAILQWPGARIAAAAVAVVAVLASVLNTAALGNFEDNALAFHKIYPNDGFLTLKSPGFFDLNSLDMTSVYNEVYDGAAFYLAWYPTLAAIPMHLVIVFAVVVIVDNKGRRVDEPFALTDRGVNSLLNYIFHYLVVLACVPLGLYRGFSAWRLALALVLPCIFAQLWMWPLLAPTLRKVLGPPLPLGFLLLDEDEPTTGGIASTSIGRPAYIAPVT